MDRTAVKSSSADLHAMPLMNALLQEVGKEAQALELWL